MIWNELIAYLKRNFWILAVAVILAVAYPWTLMFSIPITLVSLAPLLLLWRVRKTQEGMFGQNEEQHTNNQGFNQRRRQKREGEVTVVHTSESTEPRISDDVGEYVDFKEVKEKKTK